MSILKLENVGYRYKDAPKDSYVFKNVNYEFEQGKMYAIKEWKRKNNIIITYYRIREMYRRKGFI